MGKPTLYLIAGPNGAGKSTLYKSAILPAVPNAPFVNADNIQREQFNDNDPAAPLKAAELAAKQRDALLAAGKSFVTESVFSHPSKLQLLDDAKAAGFRTVLYHVQVRSSNISVERVASRVAEGGHDVPTEKIRQRFERSQALIKEATTRADRAYVYDNSQIDRSPTLLFKMEHGRVTGLGTPNQDKSPAIPAWARTLYAEELSPFSEAALNPAAASFKDAKEIAQRQYGSNAIVSIAKGNSSHTGAIVGRTSMHVLQHVGIDKAGNNQLVAHFTNRLSSEPGIGKQTRIDYVKDGKPAVVRVLEPSEANIEKGTKDTATDQRLQLTLEQAEAFAKTLNKKQDRERFLKGVYERLGIQQKSPGSNVTQAQKPTDGATNKNDKSSI